jgi:hypothetical protein
MQCKYCNTINIGQSSISSMISNNFTEKEKYISVIDQVVRNFSLFILNEKWFRSLFLMYLI